MADDTQGQAAGADSVAGDKTGDAAMKEKLRDAARLIGQASSILAALVGAGNSADSYYKSLEEQIKTMISDATETIKKCAESLTEAQKAVAEVQKKATEENIKAEVEKRVAEELKPIRDQIAALRGSR